MSAVFGLWQKRHVLQQLVQNTPRWKIFPVCGTNFHNVHTQAEQIWST
jgi:hypothetical protein